MYIPTHYAVVLFAILLLESTALFVYTLIGLIKSNPLPYIVSPAPQYPAYQYPAPPMMQAPQTIASVHTKVVTATVSTTVLLRQGANGIETVDFKGTLPALALTGFSTSTTQQDSNSRTLSPSDTSSSNEDSNSSTRSKSTTSKPASSSTSQPVETVTVKSTAKPTRRPKVVWATTTVPPPPAKSH